jgi:hypothetical protein
MPGWVSALLFGVGARNISENHSVELSSPVPGRRPLERGVRALDTEVSSTAIAADLPNPLYQTHPFASLLTSAEKRYRNDQIKRHEFFYRVDWDVLRQVQPPFVPHLRSIVDTSYFPTDDIEQPNPGDVIPPPGLGSVDGNSDVQRDVAFLGCVIFLAYFIAELIRLGRACSYTFHRFNGTSNAF